TNTSDDPRAGGPVVLPGGFANRLRSKEKKESASAIRKLPSPRRERWKGELVLEHPVHKLEQGLGPRIVGNSNIGVDLVVRRFPAAVERHRDFVLLEDRGKALRLGGRVGMLGHVNDQKRRNSLPLGDVRDGGEILMLGRVVAEFLAVPKLRLRLIVNTAARFGGLDDRRDVECVPIDGDAALDKRERSPFRLEIPVV